MKTLTPLAVLILLFGCATTPVPTSDAIAVPTDRLLDPSAFVARPSTSAVTVKRDRGAVGSACATRLFLNAKPVADIRAGEAAVLHLLPGEYMLGAQNASILCGGGISETKAAIRPGESSTYRISISANGELMLAPTAF